MKLTQKDYEERLKRLAEESGTSEQRDEDRRLVKLYEREGYSCPGSSTETSSGEQPKTSETNETPARRTARTTERTSKNEQTESSTARSTAGSGKAGS